MMLRNRIQSNMKSHRCEAGGGWTAVEKNKSGKEDPGGLRGDILGEGRALGRLLAVTLEQRTVRSGVM